MCGLRFAVCQTADLTVRGDQIHVVTASVRKLWSNRAC